MRKLHSEDAALWLPAARAGSPEALGRLLEACHGYLLMIAKHEFDPALHPKGGASDLVQETFLDAQRGFGGFGGFGGGSEAELRAWLRRLLLNNLVSFGRLYRGTGKRQVGREVAIGGGDSTCSYTGVAEPVAETPSPSRQAMAREEAEATRRALERLPEDYRRVLLLRYEVLHRDLNPANVLLENGEGRAEGPSAAGAEAPGRDVSGPGLVLVPRITDFGLAKFMSDDHGPGPTRSEAVLGTPSYMAPEQAEGRSRDVGPAADVYALGAILYEILTGRAPFRGESDLDTLQQVRDDDPVSPRRLRAEVPRDLEVICLKCLEKDSRRRYSGAQALSDDLRAWLAGRPIAARPAGAVERLALLVRRRPTLATNYGLVAVVLILFGFGGSVAWLWRAAERARAEAEQAHKGELRSRGVAEQARNSEALARAAAELARDGEAQARAEAERQREKVERIEYGRTLQVALEEWRANNITATRALLESTRPDLRGWEWRHLNLLCHSELFSLNDTSDTESTSFSPDGSRIMTAGKSGRAKLWDAASGVALTPLRGHALQVTSASFSPDGSRIVTGSFDKTAKLWDSATGTEFMTLNGHTTAVYSASFSPDGSRIVTASEDRTVKVWDAATGMDLLTFKGHAGSVRSSMFSPDGSRILTCGNEGTARVWHAGPE